MPNPTAASTSSTPLADCGRSDAALADLGRRLLRELEKEPQHADTATRWLAHRLAELLDRVEMAVGREREEAANACRDTVLLLWRHRSVMPRGRRPLESFEPVLQTLRDLRDPDARWFRQFDNEEVPEGGAPFAMADLARAIDRGARDAIRVCLALAAAAGAEDEADWTSSGAEATIACVAGLDHDALRVVSVLNSDAKDLLAEHAALAVAERQHLRASLERLRGAVDLLLESLPAAPADDTAATPA